MKNTENLTRRAFMRSSAMALAGSTLLSGCRTRRVTAPKKRPNLLFVFSDQQSRDTLGCYGNKDVISPNLDKLAGEGIRFDHCVSVSPVCTPFRGMLLSGMHPLYTGSYCNDRPLLTNNGKHFPHVLQEAGYRMGYVGKWHLLGGDRDRPIPAGPMQFGFDDTFLSNNCHVDFRPGKCYYWNERDEKVFFPDWEAYGQTRQAVEFLDQCSPDEPFAMFVSWHPPHDLGIDRDSLVFNYDTIPELMDLYDPDKITLRPSVKDTLEVRKAYQGYYAMCTGVDKSFGLLMDKLKEKGLDDNTIVVFTSDHGDNLTSYDYHIAKDHPEDTSTRIPFLMRLPGGKMKGETSELLLGPMDMMPTILSMMDLPVPDGLHGTDLSEPIKTGDDDAVESLPLFFFNPYWSGVYTRDVTYGKGELMHYAKTTLETVPVRALYDRRNDPDQLNNLFDDPKAQPLREKMEKLTRQWQDHFGDPGGINAKQIDGLYKMPDGSWPIDTQAEGFPGRPIDIVSKISKMSKG